MGRSPVGRLIGILAVLGLLLPLATLAGAPTASAQSVPTDFVIQGGGWGHGIGMSQHGAQGRAVAGQGYGQILNFYYPGAALTPAAPETVRVALGGEVGAVEVTGNGTGVPFYPGGWAQPIFVASPGQTVNLVAQNGQFAIPGGAAPFAAVGATVAVPIPAGASITVSSTGIRYSHGTLAFTLTGAGTIQVAVHLSMEDYLYGIAEVPFGWHPEALRSQVVAARSYAGNVAARRRAQGGPFDLLATTSDQVYSGYETEVRANFAAWKAAVDATAGQVLTYGGAVVQAFYSSSNGGWTERSGYVFLTDYPYFQAVEDAFDSGGGNPRHRWSEKVTNADFRAAVLARTQKDVGPVTGWSVTGTRGGSGRIDKATVTVTGTSGSATVSGTGFQSMLGLNSTLIFDRDGTPFGAVDELYLWPGGLVRVKGWAIDANTSGSIPIAVVIDGTWVHTLPSTTERPEVEAANPGWGAAHGFHDVVWAPTGAHQICLVAVNQGPGENTVLGCKWLQIVPPGPPFGNIDASATEPGFAAMAGWAIDPDVTGPVDVHVSIDNGAQWAVTTTGTGRPRPDVGAAFPGFGDDRGWDVKFPLAAGVHTACVFVVNQGAGAHASLGCVNLSVP